MWLSGVHPKETEGADVRNGTTADQIAAQHIGGDTPLTSLELAMEQTYLIGNCDNGYSCVYTNSISWRTPTTPNPHETNPRIVFQRMFGDGGSPEQRLAQLQEDRSILDWVTRDISHLQQKLGAADRNSVSEYLDSVREIERRIQVAERQHGESTLELPDRPIGVPESYDEHARLMFDLLAVAFKADITRVFVFTLGKEQTNRAYPELGVNAAHHAVSHHQHDPLKFEQGAKINQYHIGLTAHLLDKLKSTPDGDGNLLDHSLDPARRRHQRRQRALAHRPAAGHGGRRRRREGRPGAAPLEGHPDEQPPRRDARSRRGAGRQVRRRHRLAPDRADSSRSPACSRPPHSAASAPMTGRPPVIGAIPARQQCDITETAVRPTALDRSEPECHAGRSARIDPARLREGERNRSAGLVQNECGRSEESPA